MPLDASTVHPNSTPYFSVHRHTNFGVQQLHPQWQIHVPNILQHHHEYGSPFRAIESPFPSRTIGLSGLSPRAAQAAEVVVASSSSANLCGLAASLVNQEARRRTIMIYSSEMKREFCLFKRNWLSKRPDGTRCEAWQSALRAFLGSYLKDPGQLIGFRGLDGISDTNISQKQKFQPV